MHPTYVALNEELLETGAWLYGVHRTCTEMAAVSRGTSHATTKQRCRYITTVDIQDKNTRYRKRQSYSESHVTRAQ